MKIVEVEAMALSAPWEKIFGGIDRVPAHLLRPAANQVATPRRGQAATLVRIRTDNGLEGIGEAYGLHAPELTAIMVAQLFRPVLIGRNPMETGVIWELLYGMQQGNGHTRGYALMAQAGVDMALWDLKGKYLGQPVYQLLGGAYRTAIPVYASPVPFLTEPAESAAHARAFVEEGFSAVKLKVGRGVAKDVAHLAAVREALGPAIRVMLDANCGYDVRTALELSKAAAAYDPYWLEEPLPPENIEGLAFIRRHAGLRIAAGECEHSAFGVRDLLTRQAVDVIQPNIARAGGITEAQRIAALSHLFGIPVAPHGVGSAVAIAAALHWMAATPNFLIYEYNRFLNPIREEILRQPLCLQGGCLTVPEGPGLGIEVDPAAVERYCVARF
jgi:D-arabinonate dehydratase/D-galactarolactone cycloisomerase